MKKLFLSAAVVMGSLAFAQQFGIKAGMNVSSLSDDATLSDQSSKIGFNAGVFMNAPIAENFSIQPEILYNNLGSKVTLTKTDVGNTTYRTEYARHLDYITVPVMFQYNATPAFYLEAGPEFGLMVSAKDKLKSTENGNTTGTVTSDISTDNFNTFNFGVGLGAGYYFTPNVGLTARYTAGLSDIAKDRPSGSDAVKNNVFQVGLAYKF
ncbi:PorT family protein [Chryseobacterium salipaludis]|uniref:porin family protein n=1 Tax=Chryseobacterium TaxID=59732 RepID=UPI001FF6652C|nr:MULTISPECIES: porin family protein [Chryseobacterium]MCJ8496771.1 PorT family protein [Chryseobacterium salipaludis]MCX3296252.1 porin family protein [Planobacterium sp. JC490]